MHPFTRRKPRAFSAQGIEESSCGILGNHAHEERGLPGPGAAALAPAGASGTVYPVELRVATGTTVVQHRRDPVGLAAAVDQHQHLHGTSPVTAGAPALAGSRGGWVWR